MCGFESRLTHLASGGDLYLSACEPPFAENALSGPQEMEVDLDLVNLPGPHTAWCLEGQTLSESWGLGVCSVTNGTQSLVHTGQALPQ